MTMIKYVAVRQATCDRCNQTVMQTNVTQIKFISFIRGLKWTVSNNQVLCPLCRNEKDTPKQLALEFDD